jgi:hypothetical protein
MRHILFFILLTITQSTWSQSITADTVAHHAIRLKEYEAYRFLNTSDTEIQYLLQYIHYRASELSASGFSSKFKFFFISYYTSIPIVYFSMQVEELGPTKYLIIAIDTSGRQKKIYRISGFQSCDFLELLWDNSICFSQTNHVLKEVKNLRTFLKTYKIESVNMKLMHKSLIKRKKLALFYHWFKYSEFDWPDRDTPDFDIFPIPIFPIKRNTINE